MNKYNVIIKVYETGSISKAAMRLNYSQPAVSQVIASVERELGFPLFRRLRTGVKLTKEGEMLLPSFQNIAEEEMRIQEIAHSITGLHEGSLCISAIPSVGRQWLPDIIKNFSKDYPMVEYDLMYGIAETIQKELCEGKRDCGFITLISDHEELDFTPVCQDEFIVILPNGHPLAEHDEVLLHEIAGEPFILPAEKLDAALEDIFSKNHLTPNIYLKGRDDISTIRMIENGLGVGILSELGIAGLPACGGVVYRKFREHYARTIGIAVRKNQKPGLLMEKFLQYADRYLKGRY